MCGRAQYLKVPEIVGEFGPARVGDIVDAVLAEEAFPRSVVPGLVLHKDERVVSSFTWGFFDDGTGHNARLETAADRTAWRDAFASARLVLPLARFVEGRAWFSDASGGPLAVAGLYRLGALPPADSAGPPTAGRLGLSGPRRPDRPPTDGPSGLSDPRRPDRPATDGRSGLSDPRRPDRPATDGRSGHPRRPARRPTGARLSLPDPPGSPGDRPGGPTAPPMASRPARRATMLTRPADDLVAPFHDRMPVILPADLIGPWLAGEPVPLA
ncbi:MAG: response associated peptidase, partial [Actinomycetota bacterium]|nr:response associated peptidase [Actinomycetota bacterium]